MTRSSGIAASEPVSPDILDPIEVEILRRYFGLGSSGIDAAQLLEPETVDEGVDGNAEDVDDDDEDLDADQRRDAKAGVRVTRRRLAGEDFPGDARIANAVARICLNAIQHRLPAFYVSKPDGGLECGRRIDPRRPAAVVPLSRPLFGINWADSGPGFSWPEEYHVTLVPSFQRFVVTMSQDSYDLWGCTDLAIGWFRARARLLPCCERVVTTWWRHQHRGHEQERWQCVLWAGEVSREEAERWADAVWGADDRENST